MRIVILLLTLVGALQAYTDPGTGILLWQIMLAVFAGLMFKFRTIVGKLRGAGKPPTDEAARPTESDRT